MICIEVSGFYYTIDVGPSLAFLLVNLLLRFCSFETEEPVPSCAPEDHRWNRCWSGAGYNWPACQFSLVLTIRVSSSALFWQVHPLQRWERGRASSSPTFRFLGWVPHTYIFRVLSTVLHRCGLGAGAALQLLWSQGQPSHLPWALMGVGGRHLSLAMPLHDRRVTGTTFPCSPTLLPMRFVLLCCPGPAEALS